MDDLAVQVRQVDPVVVDDPDRPHTRRGEVEQSRRAEPARAHDEHLRVREPLLPRHAEFRQDELPRVAGDVLATEAGVRAWLPWCWHGHTLTPL